MEPLYAWLGIAVVFLIVEILTTTFYGLSIALAAAITGFYVYLNMDDATVLMQGIVFLVSVVVFALLLPKVLRSHAPDVPQGADKYIGEKRTVKKVGGDLKISLDGVDYLLESDEDLEVGNKVEVTGHKGASMLVKKV